MNRVRPWLLLVLVFVAGMGVGMMGTRAVARYLIINPGVIGAQLERDLFRELNLTPEQRVKAQKIFAHTQEQLRALRGETQGRVRTILESSNEEIAAILTPEQLPAFKKWVEQKRQRAQSFTERRGPFPQRPQDRPPRAPQR